LVEKLKSGLNLQYTTTSIKEQEHDE